MGDLYGDEDVGKLAKSLRVAEAASLRKPTLKRKKVAGTLVPEKALGDDESESQEIISLETLVRAMKEALG